MPIFKPGTVARVPFPYTDRATRQHRPAIVVSDGGIGPDGALLWVVMVTSAEHRRWPGDVSLADDHAAAGLPGPSLIRTAKIATIDTAAAEWRGEITPARLAEVRAAIARHLNSYETPPS